MPKRLSERIAYARYRKAQIRQSHAKRQKDASFRTRPFVETIKATVPALGRDSAVLCIGARNEIELDVFLEAGFGRVSAVDLWSASPRIRVGDMHALPFEDGSFDLIYASHVFEHAYDFPRVVSECMRVIRSPGYLFCAVPVNFETNAHDRYDFRNGEGFLAHFAGRSFEVLYERLLPTELSIMLHLRH